MGPAEPHLEALAVRGGLAVHHPADQEDRHPEDLAAHHPEARADPADHHPEARADHHPEGRAGLADQEVQAGLADQEGHRPEDQEDREGHHRGDPCLAGPCQGGPCREGHRDPQDRVRLGGRRRRGRPGS